MKYRLTTQPYELIDRTDEISFKWNNKSFSAYEGDSLAAALLAGGVKIFNYSFKYGRARGLFSSWVDEPNALINWEKNGYYVPNSRATEIEVYQDLEAFLPRGPRLLGWEIKHLLSPFHKIMPAGFYYKTFMQPQKLWRLYEKFIRQFAGVSAVPDSTDEETYEHYHQHCDLLIIGGGVTGISAALAAPSNKKVILLDDRPRLGGQWHSAIRTQLEGKHICEWIKVQEGLLRKASNITLVQRTSVYARFDHNLILALEKRQDHIPLRQRDKNKARQRLHRIRCKDLLIATGAFERPIAFPGNDLPGIMLANAVQDYMNRYGVLAGVKPVIYTNNDSAYELVRDLLANQLSPVLIDLRQDTTPPADLVDKIEFVAHSEIIATSGNKDGISQLELRNLSTGVLSKLSCDLLALSGGFDPVVHLSCHLGAKPTWDSELQCFLPQDKAAYYAGAVNGYWLAQDCLSDAKAVMAKMATNEPTRPAQKNNFNLSPQYYTKGPGSKGQKQFIDFQNDVTKADIELAIRENYTNIEHIKRYTALGFGNDQGKTSNVVGINLAADILGRKVNEVGTTTYRPAYTPVTFAALAGHNQAELYDPKRYTAMHFNHLVDTEEFEVVGQWMRPWYFPQGDEDIYQAVEREVLAAHNSVAMMDASTLGKIDVQGPDAREFLNRIYPNAWSKLAVGKCRYSIMLDENGMIFDDGVTACIDENRFLMTTTTGGAAHVYSWLETWLQSEWPELELYINSVTDHWATTAVVGPKSRDVMRKLCTDVDFSQEAFAFMEWKPGTVCGIPARIMRISFSGELAYEINVQANYASYVWEKVRSAGHEYDITPYGTETMHVLRGEKGYIIAGQDTDGSMTPVDMDMEWIMAKKKAFSYLGKRSLARSDMLREDRKQLVGLLSQDAKSVLPEGCALLTSPQDRQDNQGFVSSSYYSPRLGRPIAFGLLKGGSKRMGEMIYACTKDGNIIEAEVTNYVFYDPKGERKDG